MRLDFARSLVVAALVGVSFSAHADTITDLIDVTASGSGQTVNLDYSLTWDPTQNYLNPTTTGLTLLSATTNDPAFAASLDVTPEWDYFFAPNGSFNIGGANAALGGGLGAIRGTTDYLLDFYLDNSVPHFAGLGVSDASGAVSLQDGSVTITPVPEANAVTPEPSSVLLLGTGLLGVAGLVRRRHA